MNNVSNPFSKVINACRTPFDTKWSQLQVSMGTRVIVRLTKRNLDYRVELVNQESHFAWELVV